MTQIVINCEPGGFDLSELALIRYRELAGVEFTEFRWKIDRSEPHLVQTVLELGHKANGPYAELKVVEIPDDVNWQIHEHEGCEWIAETHRTWR